MMRKYSIALMVYSLLYVPFAADAAQPTGSDPEFDKILSLDIAELTVTSVSKTAEKASDAAASVYVLTQRDLHRAGVTSIPEALRMVPGVQVAQTSAHGWAVSVRGFNNALANKLLVLMDGRSIYSPIYSGVYWDAEDTMIEDIERIEVIRGPGAALWGANAVNGVINIVTKKAADTQGAYISESLGTQEYNTTTARYGGKLSEDTHYRVYAKQQHWGKLDALNGGDAFDEWSRLRTGFRIDKSGDKDSYTVQGDGYGGNQELLATQPSLTPPYSSAVPSQDDINGGNMLVRWDHTISDKSNTSLQAYVNHYARNETVAQQRVTTADIDFQHVIKPSSRDEIVWGGGYRFVTDDLRARPTANFTDSSRQYDVWNLFVQNQYALLPEKLFWTLGSKFENNDFTGFEFQPSTRLSWKIDEKQTAWAAVSRAVRVPSRVENDLDYIALVSPATTPDNPPNVYHVLGNGSLDAEELLAYEVGYRVYPTAKTSLDISGFFNHYDNLVTVESVSSPVMTGTERALTYSFTNTGSGNVYGVETSANWNVTSSWQLTAGYSYLLMDLQRKPGTATNVTNTERANPHHQFSLRSYLDLPHNLQWDNMLYYTDDLTVSNNRLHIDSNVRFDTRLGWKPAKEWEVSVIGRNLLNAKHPEFSGSGAPTVEIGRTLLGTVAWKF